MPFLEPPDRVVEAEAIPARQGPRFRGSRALRIMVARYRRQPTVPGGIRPQRHRLSRQSLTDPQILRYSGVGDMDRTRGRCFQILFGREDEKIEKISIKYKDVPIPEKLAIFDGSQLLQIAINQGKANELLGLKFHDIIRIEFK